MTPDSILNVDVSAYSAYDTPEPKTVNLLTFLQSPKYKDKADTVKIAPDKKSRDAIKATLPAITPSGIFTRRGEENLQSHTGFIQFDINPKGNERFFGECETLADYEAVTADIKSWLQDLPFVAYAAVSVSGRGVWGLIPLSDPTQHKAHFRSMQRDFAQMGINIDPAPKSIASLRGYSYDPTAYYNHHAVKYTGLEAETRSETPKIERPAPEPSRDGYITDQGRVEKMVEHIARSGRDITNGYENWFKIAGALSSAFGEWGRAYFHDLSRNNPEYDGRKTDKQFDACLRGKGYGIGTFYQVCEQHGFRYKEIVPLPERYDKLPARIIQLPGQEGIDAPPAFDPEAWMYANEYNPTVHVETPPPVISLRLDGKDYPILGKGMICFVVAEEKAGKSTLIYGPAEAVQVRFRHGADDNAVDKGWDIDDIELTDDASKPFYAFVAHRDLCDENGPKVNGGAGKTVPPRTQVTLAGTGAHPANAPLTYMWSQVEGPEVALEGKDSANLVFVSPDVAADTKLSFVLRAHDEALLSPGSRVDVTVSPAFDAVPTVSGGCGCHTAENRGESAFATFGLAALVLGVVRRRRAR